MPSLKTRTDLDAPPTMEEFLNILSRVKLKKTGGMSRITPEMILFGGSVFHQALLNVFRKVWRDGEVFEEWKNSMVIPIPKRGYLSLCM